MKYNNIFEKIISFENLILAWKKARKHKTTKSYVIEFERELFYNLIALHYELKYQTYSPKPLITFILRDPKTRKISKSDFRDRIVHHAICNILEPIYERIFISDSCANRIGKGNLFALKQFYKYTRKVSRNGTISPNKFKDNNYIKGYCLKADIKHYFQEVNHEILLNILRKKIADEQVLKLIKQINQNFSNAERERVILKDGVVGENLVSLQGMPLGNLTSQFLANVYLNELDYFIKHELKAKYYIRYVDDFVILHSSKEQLAKWKEQINLFLIEKLKLELHQDKSKIIPLSRGIDFVGFRNFYHFRLLRKRNIRKMANKLNKFEKGETYYQEIIESFQGWNAYAKWANTLNLRKGVIKQIHKVKKELMKTNEQLNVELSNYL